MTAQVSDSISIDGKSHALCVLPLESLFKAMPNRPNFESPHTANWRGYVASWKIDNDRLWLVGLRGRLAAKKLGSLDSYIRKATKDPREDHKKLISRIERLPQNSIGIRQSDHEWFGWSISDENGFVDLKAVGGITIEQLFCSDEVPVPACWYSGLLRIPLGKQLQYVHGGFHSDYETDLIVEIDAGIVRRQWMIDNKPGHEARKNAEEIQQKSILALKPAFDIANHGKYRDAIKSPLDAVKSASKMKGNCLSESIHYFLRSHFLRQAVGSAVMSNEDQHARAAYEEALTAIEQARMAIGMTISLQRYAAVLCKTPLGDFALIMHMKAEYCERAAEMIQDLSIPSGDEEQIEWAIGNVRLAEKLIAESKFELLGASEGIVYEVANSPSIDD